MKKSGLLGLFFVGLLLSVGFASAVLSELQARDFDGAIRSLTDISTPTFVKVLLFFLVLVVVYGVSNYLPFFEEKGFVSFIFSAIVATLAIVFLRSEEIYAVLGSYKALGVVISAVIPFFIIAAISRKSYEKGHPFLGRALWVAFIVILLWIILFFEKSDGSFGNWVYPLILVLSLGMFLWEKKLYMKLFMYSTRAEIENAHHDLITNIKAEIARIDAALSAPSLSAADVRRLDAEKSRLVKRLDDLS